MGNLPVGPFRRITSHRWRCDVETSIFCFPVDFADGIDRVLEDVVSAGIGGVTVAAAYHSARDYLPHNSSRRVHYSPAGISFHSDASRYPAQPSPHPLLAVCAGRDLLRDVVDAAAALRLKTNAWVVYLHYDAEPASVGDGTGFVQNAFGDVCPVALCPASPATRLYVEQLTAEVCERRPNSILAEALHYMPFDHDYHHERSFAPLGELAKLLLSFCFCPDCRRAGADSGLDMDAIASWIRRMVDSPDEGAAGSALDREALCAYADQVLGDTVLERYLRLRELHVHRVITACRAVAESFGIPFCFLDVSIALSEADGGRGARARSWELGVARDTVAAGGEFVTALYVRDSTRFSECLDTLTAHLGRPPDGAVIRPMAIDSPNMLTLLEKRETLIGRGVNWVGYYHYGLMERKLLRESVAPSLIPRSESPHTRQIQRRS